MKNTKLYEAAKDVLDELSKYIGVNTFFVASNDGKINRITNVLNKETRLLTEGVDAPFEEAYCSLVVADSSQQLVISQLDNHPLTRHMEITKQLGKGSFVGVPIYYKNGKIYGTLCAMDDKHYSFSEQEIQMLHSMARFLTHMVEVEDKMELYKQIVEKSPMGVLVTQDKEQAYGNPAVEDSAKHLLAHFQSAADNDVKGRYEISAIEGDETKAFEILTGTIEFSGKKADLHLVQDVSDRVKYERALQHMKEDLENILSHQLGLTFKIVKQGDRFVYTMVSGALLQELGLTKDQVIGQSIADFFPELETLYSQRYSEAWSGKKVSYESTLNGITYIVSLVPIFDKGKVIEVIASGMDITKRKEYEESLKASETKFRLIAENMSDLLVVCEIDGTIQYASPSNFRTLGYYEHELIGRNGLDGVHPDYAQSFAKQWDTCIKEHKEMKVVFRYQHKKGHYIELDGRGVPIIDEQKQVISMVLVCRDMTERRSTEKLLIQAEKLTIAGELAAGIAHEIRNPLTSLKGFLQLIHKDRSWNDTYIEIMSSEMHRIEVILSELLVLAKPQVSQKSSIDLQPILIDVITLLEAQANMKNIMISSKMLNSGIVVGDPYQLKQVFINFLKNAIESMSDGGTIQVELAETELHYHISFKDEGCGIPEHLLTKIGEPFYSTKEKGTGLGMMVSRRIVQEHGGSFTIHSKVGVGTTIDVKLLKKVTENADKELI